MKYPDDANGDVFRRMEAHGFDFSAEHVVDFHAVYATEADADQIAQMYLADHNRHEKEDPLLNDLHFQTKGREYRKSMHDRRDESVS